MTLPPGIGENISYPQSTLPLEWLQAQGITSTRSPISSYSPEVWAHAQRVLAERHAAGIDCLIPWNTEGSGLPAWPARGTLYELDYIERWKDFLSGVPRGAVSIATCGNELSTPGWVDTNGHPIGFGLMAHTAELFAQACAPYGVQPWASSIHTHPADAIELAKAADGLVYGVPYHPYYRSLRGLPSTPWAHSEGLEGQWRFGTVEDVLALFAGEIEGQDGYPSGVALCFDEMGCPTVFDEIGEAGQAHYCAGVVLLDHPKLLRCWYFTGPMAAVPDGELAEGKDFYIQGRPLAELAFRPVAGGGGQVEWSEGLPRDVWAGLWQEVRGESAVYHHDFGIPKWWRGADDGVQRWRDLGPAMWDGEVKAPHETDTNADGSPVMLRFMKFAGGLVRWDPRTGATIV